MKFTLFLVAWTFTGVGFVATSPIPTSPQPREANSPPPEGHKPLLEWDPPNAFQRYFRRKVKWEEACHEALTRYGCGAGRIHKGEAKLLENGQNKPFLRVEGAQTAGMEYDKKMRVFLDGTFADGWSTKDEKTIAQAKRPRKTHRPLEDLPLQESEKAVLLWDPVDAYTGREKWREYWEELCGRALAKNGCHFGVIHQGVRSAAKPNGKKSPYVNVEAIPSVGQYKGQMKKMRVHEDGSIQNDWSFNDRKYLLEIKAKRQKHEHPHLDDPQALDVQTPHVFWDPVDAYTTFQPLRRAYWEERCRKALRNQHCNVGKIHMGEKRFTKNGQNKPYILVEGAKSMDDMENSKKMRVFKDSSSANGWSRRDLDLMMMTKYHAPRNKYTRPRVEPGTMETPRPVDVTDALEGSQPWEGPRAHLSWDPKDAYLKLRHRRVRWEKACDRALAKEGCRVGRIHQGESRSLTNGKGYLRVEGAPSIGMAFGKKMRVFQDGSYEHGWSQKDEELLKMAKRKFYKRIQKDNSRVEAPPLQPPGSPSQRHGPGEAEEYHFSGAEHVVQHPGPIHTPSGREHSPASQANLLFSEPSPPGPFYGPGISESSPTSHAHLMFSGPSPGQFQAHYGSEPSPTSHAHMMFPEPSPPGPFYAHNMREYSPSSQANYPFSEPSPVPFHALLGDESLMSPTRPAPAQTQTMYTSPQFRVPTGSGSEHSPATQAHLLFSEPYPGLFHALRGDEHLMSPTQPSPAQTMPSRPPPQQFQTPTPASPGGSEHSPATQAHLLFSEPSPGLFHALRGDEHLFSSTWPAQVQTTYSGTHPGPSQAPGEDNIGSQAHTGTHQGRF